MDSQVDVAVAVILQNDHILIAQRHQASHQGGKWEFPGGKIEKSETTDQALVRELEEELGVVVTEQTPFLVVEHEYPDKRVMLDIHLVTGFSGTATGKEGQPIRWVKISDLNNYDFPDANVEIVEKLLNDFL